MDKLLTAEEIEKLRELGIDYMVTKTQDHLPGLELVHQTSSFNVYRTR